ncbi:MAG TPA: hypothetical protein VM656_16265 [Pyrinomonadaceae bacterium]|nr:hypothetical protein [Pyrinomonadaceae bacterium]
MFAQTRYLKRQGLNEETRHPRNRQPHVRLRKYIEDDPTKPKHQLTVTGVGYRFAGLNKDDSSLAKKT